MFERQAFCKSIRHRVLYDIRDTQSNPQSNHDPLDESAMSYKYQ